MLRKIKNRRETVTEKVYVLEDDNTGELGTYNMDGELLRVDPPKAGDVRALKFNRIQTSEEEGGTEGLKKPHNSQFSITFKAAIKNEKNRPKSGVGKPCSG